VPKTWSNRFLRFTVAALAAIICLTVTATREAYAATTTVISDTASCTAFGGTWDTNHRSCEVNRPVTIAAGNTLEVRIPADFDDIVNNGTFTVSDRGWVATGSITNNVGAVINGGGDVLRTYGDSINYGTINGRIETARVFTNASTGQMNITGQLFLAAVLTNNGTITMKCGGYISAIYDGRVDGNAPTDGCPPSATINQATDQADPANSAPLRFTATFSEPVTGLTGADVKLAGSADLSGATVTVSGGPSTYTISVAGVAGSGSVTASLAADVANDGGGNGNTAATSTDNKVVYDATPPADNKNINGTRTNGWYTSDVKVDWNWSDSGTGIDAAHCAQNSTSNGDGDAVKISGGCQDQAGNAATDSVTVKVDKTPPAVSCVTPAPVVPLGGSAAISASVGDATSGPEQPTVSAAADTTTAGHKTKSLTGTDKAGNTTTVDCAYTVAAPQPAAAAPIAAAPAPAAAPAVQPAAADCMGGMLRLVDVRMSGRRVVLAGETSKANAGRDVTLLLDGRALTTARVLPDGTFRTSAALPARSLRRGNQARYTAVLGNLRSSALKLTRRIHITGISSRAGMVTIAGHVDRPLAQPVRTVTLREYGDCEGARLLRTLDGIRVSRSGDFRATVRAPAGSVAYYRASTQVPKTTGSARAFPTFTLLRGVTLAH
jgi:hypothetical protein